MTGSPHYHRDEADTLLTCPLDDIVLLYHRKSGQTHMVISPVPEILATLVDGASATAADIHARLAAHYDLGQQDDAIAGIAAHLANLAALGLVRRS